MMMIFTWRIHSDRDDCCLRSLDWLVLRSNDMPPTSSGCTSILKPLVPWCSSSPSPIGIPFSFAFFLSFLPLPFPRRGAFDDVQPELPFDPPLCAPPSGTSAARGIFSSEATSLWTAGTRASWNPFLFVFLNSSCTRSRNCKAPTCPTLGSMMAKKVCPSAIR
uniref:Uncharacterized protein n=1 Tax=Triticum urartu TaxID=4572 RepID=A0A8R7V5Z5_TRIUA